MKIKNWASELGLTLAGISSGVSDSSTAHYKKWIEKGFHGQMDYMAKNETKRFDPELLLPKTASVISLRMDYFRETPEPDRPGKAYVAKYALGRDYHKVLKKRLERLAAKIREEIGPFNYRVFTDSAPVMEVEMAVNAGVGWRGKHSLLLSKTGSWFFLGEIYTDIPFPSDPPQKNHCGSCDKCMVSCPTQAIVEPYVVDARKCISYLTIENKGSIPVEFRKAMGNRIYGCDDCQLFCPWNRFAETTQEPDFGVRNHLDDLSLAEIFSWTREMFEKKMAGSAIYRIGFERFMRNVAVALGNSPGTAGVTEALNGKKDHPSALLREHVAWALEQHK